MEIQGHKVFVFEHDGSPCIEMVNDDRPLVRMAVELSPDEAREIARSLNELAGRRPRRRRFQCVLGHTWSGDRRNGWACDRCGAAPRQCDNCGRQHDPTTFLTVCTVTRRSL